MFAPYLQARLGDSINVENIWKDSLIYIYNILLFCFYLKLGILKTKHNLYLQSSSHISIQWRRLSISILTEIKLLNNKEELSNKKASLWLLVLFNSNKACKQSKFKKKPFSLYNIIAHHCRYFISFN